jgi:hypothetical protein
MSIHAEDPFQVTPRAGDRRVGAVVIDGAPMP